MLNFFGKRLNAVQVEVSTLCQLNCIMCPKSVFKRDWIFKHMELETFKKIPFELFEFAHLQGWGEPLLNPDIVEMIDIAKKHCRVGLTTNGLLLDEFAKDLSKLDYIAISIACADEEKHKAIRKCSLYELIDKIKALSEREKKPKITLVTMILKNTVDDLPKLVEIAKECGADEVIANNLDYIPSKDLENLAIFSKEERPEVLKVIEKAMIKAKELGIKLVVKPIRLEEVLVCAERPTENCLITYDGRVTPCVYLHLPTKSDTIKRVFNGKVVEVKKVYFGNINEKPFKEIWNSQSYKDFRNVFEKRAKVLSEFLVLDFPELPEFCKTCYKAYNV
jgi:MoaA/NifB/PqqE/SkfB family radical SAM enzyme